MALLPARMTEAGLVPLGSADAREAD